MLGAEGKTDLERLSSNGDVSNIPIVSDVQEAGEASSRLACFRYGHPMRAISSADSLPAHWDVNSKDRGKDSRSEEREGKKTSIHGRSPRAVGCIS